MLAKTPIAERYKHRWKGILPMFGLPAERLNGKHGPCPLCGGGRDRFRFTDYLGHGDFICNQCGAGDGVEFVMRMTGLSCSDALARIEEVAGIARVEAPRPWKSEVDTRKELNALWRSAATVSAGGPVAKYLEGRLGPMSAFPACLRTVEKLAYWDGDDVSYHPAMLAKVMGPGGKPVNVHRTYLTRGGRKADVQSQRKMMAGELPKGSAVRLMPPSDGTLGVAEGIETALAAAILFGIPCWAAINSSMLAAWIPPSGVSAVVVFGDNDQKYGGQAAAFTLAHRLACNGKSPISVTVELPNILGQDWADVLAERLLIGTAAAA